MDVQLKKGVLEMCLLASLEQEEQYGYDIIQNMRTAFPDVTESAFYAVLRRLHRDGSLEQFPGTISGGPPRKYYRITPAGKKALSARIADWRILVKTVSALGIC